MTHLQIVPNQHEAERLGLRAIIAVCDLAPGCLRNELLAELTRMLRGMNRTGQLVSMPAADAANAGNNLADYMTK